MEFENSCVKIRNTSPAPCLNVKTVIEDGYTMTPSHYCSVHCGLCSVPKHKFKVDLHSSLNTQTLLIGLFHDHILTLTVTQHSPHFNSVQLNFYS